MDLHADSCSLHILSLYRGKGVDVEYTKTIVLAICYPTVSCGPIRQKYSLYILGILVGYDLNKVNIEQNDSCASVSIRAASYHIINHVQD